MYGGSVGIMGK